MGILTLKGCTYKATEALLWLSMSRYLCIDSVVARWVHFFVAIDGIHRNGYRWKRCFFD